MILNHIALPARSIPSYTVAWPGSRRMPAKKSSCGDNFIQTLIRNTNISIVTPALWLTSAIPLIFIFFLVPGTANGQFYYKDLLIPAQTAEQLAGFQQHRIRAVKLLSYERDGEPTDGFSGSQQVGNNYKTLTTRLETAYSGASTLTSFFDDKGRLVRTVDTTDGAGSTTHYSYNPQGLLTVISNVSTSFGQPQETETHRWYYSDGRPDKMLRIKNGADTTTVSFVLDEKGRVIEEAAKRKNASQQSFYYYYDEHDRLTDIASYNARAGRVLPAYIFEYDGGNQLRSMMVVPEGSDDYQKWHYIYNPEGLRIKEECRDKKRQLLGRIEYQYSR